MQLRETLAMDALIVGPDCTVISALQLVSASSRSCLVIADDGGKPLGIVTEYDFTRCLLQILSTDIATPTLGEIMTSDPHCISFDADVYEALVIMESNHVRHLPVVDNEGRVIDVVSEYVLMPAYRQLIEQQQAIIDSHIHSATVELKDANANLKALAMEDPLLHVGNRRAMQVDINFTHENALRMNHQYSVAMLDIDFFKKYNDHYGHPQGDVALQFVAQILKSTVRDEDRVYRYGGEEFAVIMPETNLDGAQHLARRVIDTMGRESFPHCKASLGYLTLSIGISCFNPDNREPWKSMLNRADKHLYNAKNAGRNTFSPQP